MDGRASGRRSPLWRSTTERIVLAVRTDSDAAKRAEVIHNWHKALLHEAVPLLIQKWEQKLKVEVRGYSRN